ncbi:hypothetical protein DAEQUDRAFT_740582 [Daedalea quercina L-15889]|uniref:Zn(2)-C6 fungal-type domain-containing protein n=1 Tax=Daedalea quercina L-15889 TaxID=1314783 RepID=A0A165MF06_9APHY|nr:hypothetical protein DAEQUDRAFT_740582 [Daedalea quercina L-15889]
MDTFMYDQADANPSPDNMPIANFMFPVDLINPLAAPIPYITPLSSTIAVDGMIFPQVGPPAPYGEFISPLIEDKFDELADENQIFQELVNWKSPLEPCQPLPTLLLPEPQDVVDYKPGDLLPVAAQPDPAPAEACRAHWQPSAALEAPLGPTPFMYSAMSGRPVGFVKCSEAALVPAKRTFRRTTAVACTFCRKRKIKCGGPPVDNPDKSCLQCRRRDQACEYPAPKRARNKDRTELKSE